MNFDLFDKISSQYKDYKIEKIRSEASKRTFYRLIKDSNSLICLDSSNEKKEYYNFLKAHSYLSKVNVSIPSIYEKDDVNNIFVDDEGLLRQNQLYFSYSDRALAGNGLILGVDNAGESIASTLTVEDVKAEVQWLPEGYAIKPEIKVTAWGF